MKLSPLSSKKALDKKGTIDTTTSLLIGAAMMLLVLAGVMAGIDAFNTNQITNVAGCGRNSSGGTVNVSYNGCGAAFNLTVGVQQLSNNFGSQLGTTGAMFGVALIIASIGLLGFGLAVGARKIQ